MSLSSRISKKLFPGDPHHLRKRKFRVLIACIVMAILATVLLGGILVFSNNPRPFRGPERGTYGSDDTKSNNK
jgi:hypothetical protein